MRVLVVEGLLVASHGEADFIKVKGARKGVIATKEVHGKWDKSRLTFKCLRHALGPDDSAKSMLAS